jgi:hypothetical protein
VTVEASPIAALEPDLSRVFDMEACRGSDQSIVVFSEGLTADILADKADEEFYGPDVVYNLWSHLAQQTGS